MAKNKLLGSVATSQEIIKRIKGADVRLVAVIVPEVSGATPLQCLMRSYSVSTGACAASKREEQSPVHVEGFQCGLCTLLQAAQSLALTPPTTICVLSAGRCGRTTVHD